MKNVRIKYGTGAVLVGAVFVLFVLVTLVGVKYPGIRFLGHILLGGFIGGFTNTVAIKMLFEKKWYLPGSGVLFKSREKIIASLADTVEKHILNTRFLEEWVRDKLVDVRREDVRNALNSMVEEFREDVIKYIKTEEVHARLIRVAEDVVNRMGFIRHAVRLLTNKHDLVNMVTYHIGSEIYRFKVSGAMMDALVEKIGSLEDLLLRPDNPLVLRHYNSRKALVEYMLGQLNVKRRVIERLSDYPPEKITGIVEKNIREHLVWLEIFGVILGCFFAGIFEAGRYMFSTLA